ncbi:MAG: hypothetical protein ABII94_01090 [Patescibacteria group bacterium]
MKNPLEQSPQSTPKEIKEAEKNETVEEFNAKRKVSWGAKEQKAFEKDQEELEDKKIQQKNEDQQKIEEIRKSLKEYSNKACEQSLLCNFDSPDINWANVRGVISSRLAEIPGLGHHSNKNHKIIGEVSENITDWLKQNMGKYDNSVLASEAIKHAVRQAETNFSRLKEKGEKQE